MDMNIEHFFFDQIIFQLVSAVFIIVLEIVYFSRRKLKFLSTKYFSLVMVLSFFYIILDILSAYCVAFIDKFSYIFVKFIHQLFIVSINSLLLSIYMYVNIFNGEGKKAVHKIDRIIAVIAYLISIIFVIFGSIYYCRTSRGVYSYGVIPTTSLVLSVFYVMSTIGKSLKVSITSYFHPKQKYIFATIGVWLVFLGLKILFPSLRITCIGISLIIFILFISFESSKDYIDMETGAFKTESLKVMLVEKIHKNDKFYILNIDFENLIEVERTFGEEAVRYLTSNAVNFLNRLMKIPVYSINSYGLTMLIDKKKISEDELYSSIGKIEDRFKNSWNLKNNKVLLKTHCDFIVYPEDCVGINTLTELLTFIWECHKFTNSDDYIRKVNKNMIDSKIRSSKILSLVKNAIENDGIEMYYQPIYSIPEGKFTNVEALVRLKDSESIGFVSPEEFIPIVEKNGLIMDLSNIIFEKVFEFIQRGKLRDNKVSHIELNLSAIQSIDTSLPTQMAYLIEKYCADPEMINLEITETTMISSATMLNKNILALNRMGCSFSMDDFGTGYSNLAQMAQIAYEFIKIDKSLIWPCFDKNNPEREKAIIVLETAVKMVLNLHKEIIAEGVETKEQLDYLSSIGVNYIQGYYFSKPLCEHNYLDFLKQNNF